MEKKVIFAIVALCLLLGVLFVYAAIPLLIPSSGNIVTPATLESDTPSILWGDLVPGQVANYPVQLTNIGDVTTNSLSMSTPDVSTVGSLIWDVPVGTTIPASGVLDVTFTLTVSDTAPLGPFSFDITINA